MTDCDDHRAASNRLIVRVGWALAALAFLAVTAVALTTGAGATQTGADAPSEPAFVVALDGNGSAHTTLAVTFDLTTESERRAFERLRENATARERRAEAFATRMRAVATAVSNETGRDVGVHSPAVAFAERNDTGVVALSVVWDGLAVADGDRVVLREPFSSGFTLDRTFRVVGPEGYELAEVTPSATNRTRRTATWRDGAAFEDFQVTFTPAGPETSGDEGTGASGPGFGPVVAVVAVLVVALAVRRRDPR